jgi:hypothetical protein
MKKIIVAVAIILTLAACGGSQYSKNDTNHVVKHCADGTYKKDCGPAKPKATHHK